MSESWKGNKSKKKHRELNIDCGPRQNGSAAAQTIAGPKCFHNAGALAGQRTDQGWTSHLLEKGTVTLVDEVSSSNCNQIHSLFILSQGSLITRLFVAHLINSTNIFEILEVLQLLNIFGHTVGHLTDAVLSLNPLRSAFGIRLDRRIH